jgi:hypothetical protein
MKMKEKRLAEAEALAKERGDNYNMKVSKNLNFDLIFSGQANEEQS